MDLTRCRCGFGMDDAGIHVLNIRSRQRFLARLVPAVGLLRVLIPISIALQEFGNADASNRVYPSVLISTDVANDPIEEELRLPISMYSMSIHFRHHKATKVWLGAIGLGCSNFCKVMSMKLAAFFLQSQSGVDTLLLVLERSESDDRWRPGGHCWSRGRVSVMRRLATGSCITVGSVRSVTLRWDGLNRLVRQCCWDIHEIVNDDAACSSR